MTEKDFSTIKKTLRIIQKVQVTTKVNSFWVHCTHYDDGVISVNIIIFRHNGDESVPFDFYSFDKPSLRLNKYNKMMYFINGE